jgi:hypothetical protein
MSAIMKMGLEGFTFRKIFTDIRTGDFFDYNRSYSYRKYRPELLVTRTSGVQ